MIVPPNTYRQGVVGGFAIQPTPQLLSVMFTPNSTWVGVSGSTAGWSPTVGEQVEFVIGDNYSGLPMIAGVAFNYRGPWMRATNYGAGDVFVWYAASGVLQTWLTITAFTSGSSFNPSSPDIKQMNFRGVWAPATVYTAGDIVLAPDLSSVTQTWVALSGFTSGSTFVQGTQWAGCLANKTIFYVVGVGGSASFQLSTLLGGAAVTFMSTDFFIAPDTMPQLSAYFGVTGFIPGGGLVPALSLGALWAQGTAWVPSAVPTVPAAPVSQFSYLGYNSSTGLYWTTNPLGDTAGDAVLGWVETNATDIIAASYQDLPIESNSGGGGSNPNVFFSGLGSIPPSPVAPTGGSLISNMAFAAGVFTPDASQRYNIGVLTANAVLGAPINAPVYPMTADWTLIIGQGIGAAVFAGTGLDAASGGSYSSYAPGDTPHTYVITVSATGTPDHFTWTKDGGTPSSPVAIVPGPIALADGLTITFAATTGHTLGANWTIQVGGFTLDTTAYSQLPYGLSNSESPPGTECIQGFSSSSAGTRCITQAQMNLPIP